MGSATIVPISLSGIFFSLCRADSAETFAIFVLTLTDSLRIATGICIGKHSRGGRRIFQGLYSRLSIKSSVTRGLKREEAVFRSKFEEEAIEFLPHLCNNAQLKTDHVTACPVVKTGSWGIRLRLDTKRLSDWLTQPPVRQKHPENCNYSRRRLYFPKISALGSMAKVKLCKVHSDFWRTRYIKVLHYIEGSSAVRRSIARSTHCMRRRHGIVTVVPKADCISSLIKKKVLTASWSSWTIKSPKLSVSLGAGCSAYRGCWGAIR